MSPKPDVSAERVPHILNAAAHVFSKKGFEAARMEDIAKEAGLSVGGVYWYFKGKEEIVLAMFDQVLDPDFKDLRALLDATGTVRERLDRHLKESIVSGQYGLSLIYELFSLAGRDARVREHLQGYFVKFHACLDDLLVQGIGRGEFRKIDTEIAAAALTAIYEGTMQIYFVDQQQDLEKFLLGSVHMFLDGISA